MHRFSKILRFSCASLSLLLGWLGAIIGFVLLAAGILGAIVGQIIWSSACAMIAASAGRLERPPLREEDTTHKGYAQGASLE
ncbi:MAG TPA: hypothetical protein VMH26_08240 [Burkholderiales bacterium]|nr:hypothetical protein [Burkholderiales bacterium]